jgi:hypothetical protein
MDNFQNKNITANLKILTLGFVSLVVLIIDWFLINQALFTDKTLIYWIWPSITTAISIAVLTLFALVNNNRTYALGFGILALVTYIAIFPKDPFVFLGGMVFLALCFWFEQRIRSEETARQNFSIRSVSTAGTNVIIYAFMLLLSLNIYYNTSADFKANPESFYDALGRSAAKSTRYLGNDHGGINLSQTLDEYLETETREDTPNYDALPESFRKQALEQAKQEFFRQFDTQIRTDQPLSEVVAEFAVDRVRSSAERFSSLFPLIFTVIILALMRTFSFVLRWLSLFFTWLIYKLLIKFRFFRLSRVSVEVQKLEI